MATPLLRRWGATLTSVVSTDECGEVRWLVAVGGFGTLSRGGRDSRLDVVEAVRLGPDGTCVGGSWSAVQVVGRPFAARVHHAAWGGPDGRSVVVFGGRAGPARPLGDLLELRRVPSGGWEWAAPAPEPDVKDAPSPRWRHAAVALPDGLAVVLGGRTTDRVFSLADVFVWNHHRARWSRHAATWPEGELGSPLRHSFSAVAAARGRLVVVSGGWCTLASSAATVDDVAVLDTETFRWSPLRVAEGCGPGLRPLSVSGVRLSLALPGPSQVLVWLAKAGAGGTAEFVCVELGSDGRPSVRVPVRARFPGGDAVVDGEEGGACADIVWELQAAVAVHVPWDACGQERSADCVLHAAGGGGQCLAFGPMYGQSWVASVCRGGPDAAGAGSGLGIVVRLGGS